MISDYTNLCLAIMGKICTDLDLILDRYTFYHSRSTEVYRWPWRAGLNAPYMSVIFLKIVFIHW